MKVRLHGFIRDLPPGPTSFPHLSVDMGLRLRDNPLGTLMGYYEEYGPVFTLRFLGLEMVFLIGVEANQMLLVSDYRDFSWEHGLLGELIPFIGHGLLTTDDEAHDRARKLLAPAFYPARIKSYGERMVERAQAAIDALTVGDEVEIHGWTREVAIQIAGDVLLGMSTSEHRAAFFAEHFEQGLSYYGGYIWQTLLMRGPGSAHSRMRKHIDQLDKVIEEEINHRRRWPPGNHRAILDLLVHAEGDDGERLSHKEIRDQIFTLLFAGHDTTAATVAWLLALIGRSPSTYRKLQDEIDDRLGDRPPEIDDLFGGMPYLDQVIKETLRLYPPAWLGPDVPQRLSDLRPRGAGPDQRGLLLLAHPSPPRDLRGPGSFLPGAVHRRGFPSPAPRGLCPLRPGAPDLYRRPVRRDGDQDPGQSFDATFSPGVDAGTAIPGPHGPNHQSPGGGPTQTPASVALRHLR